MILKTLRYNRRFSWQLHRLVHLKNESKSCFKIKMSKTAGIIIIGDEILKGQTQDTNSYYITNKLHKLGISVKKISVVGDDLAIISSEVQQFSSSYDYVFTSGGIGPTHDDITFEGIASAFGEKLVLNSTLVDLCVKFITFASKTPCFCQSWNLCLAFKPDVLVTASCNWRVYFGRKELESPELKMARLPESAVLYFCTDNVKGEKFKFPLVAVKNVYIFPGIPVFLRRLIDSLQHLFSSDVSFFTNTLLINAVETDIAEVLSTCAKNFKDVGVTVGSYPDLFNNYYKVKVIVESPSESVTQTAINYIKENLPDKDILSDYIDDPIIFNGQDVLGDTIKQKHPLLHQKILHSIEILEEAFERYPRGAICIGFNGGKDCTALLHLYYAVICRKHFHNTEPFHALYIKDEHPFEELETFMNETVKRYNLNIITMDGDMKTALNKLHLQYPEVKAVVMGTRCGDPYSLNLTTFSPCDSDWPPFMRVNPLLSWTYHDVWTFLRTLFLPYCVLYDRGYTSLGSRDKTTRNSKLVYSDARGTVRYAPAYTLQDQELERNGRL